ncbi:MAG: ABC transporter ATP-binding protein [Candidatus Nitronauta litoralis]|uniref:ABC transporter ATP-binding protein n=1 Tax=Candidatus Nitronauta litoralis TaxID=2705533 RepID=A0A7T0G1I0_9BACT|nr:MAG: ABC transporter ATP-binding protein [Candidatus Nitronauta litoralis]
MDNLKRLSKLLSPYKKALFWGSIFLVISSATNLIVPMFIRDLVDVVMVKKDLAALNTMALSIFGLFIVQMVFSTGHNYLFDLTEKRVIADFRKKIFDHLHTLSLGFFVKRRTGEIMSRLTNDVTTVEGFVTDLPATVIQQSIRLLGGIVIIIYLNWKLTFTILILLPVLILYAKTYGKRLKFLSKEIQDKLANATTIIEENISCIPVVKSFVRSKLEMNRFSDAIEDTFQSAKKRVAISAFFGPTIGLISFSTALALLWYGGHEVIDGSISPGELIAFILYATIIAGPMGSFARLYTRVQEGLGASERIFEILDTKGEVSDSPDAVPMPRIEGRVCIENLHFHYREDQEVISGIQMDVEPGEMVALVGPSGAGKTTLINLLHRFYDPTQGTILVDGLPIQKAKLESYWSQIALVPQETILFGGTIEDNIRYAREGATDKDVVEAAKTANAHGFITECPDGYKTIVGEKGIRLSAGQRQRIAIARAILKNPRMLILDEATSALDNESELLIQEALDRLMKDKTSFVIAHRLSTIHNADKIIVMDKGCIVETGTHTVLMAQKGLYQKLYTLMSFQLKQEAETP